MYASLLPSQFVSPSPSQAGSSCLLCRHHDTNFCYFFYSGTWSCTKIPKGGEQHHVSSLTLLNSPKERQQEYQNNSELSLHTCQNGDQEKSTSNKCWWGYREKRTRVHWWWECKVVQPFESNMQVPQKNNRTTIWSTPGYISRKKKKRKETLIPTDTCTPMFIVICSNPAAVLMLLWFLKVSLHFCKQNGPFSKKSVNVRITVLSLTKNGCRVKPSKLTKSVD